jgi:hypothetical protein
MSHLAKAIRNLRPGSEFSFSNDDYSTIKWDVLEGKAPSQKEIDAEIAKIEVEEATAAETKAASKAALLVRLGITAEEAQLLLA